MNTRATIKPGVTFNVPLPSSLVGAQCFALVKCDTLSLPTTGNVRTARMLTDDRTGLPRLSDGADVLVGVFAAAFNAGELASIDRRFDAGMEGFSVANNLDVPLNVTVIVGVVKYDTETHKP